jgi:sporulation-control protein spo0M
MQQLNIEYFFPLTEQIPLELDFKPCTDYAEEQRKKQNYTGYTLDSWAVTGATTWATVNLKDVEPNFTINIDAMPITIQSKTKPNFFRRYIYKILGMKWKAE